MIPYDVEASAISDIDNNTPCSEIELNSMVSDVIFEVFSPLKRNFEGKDAHEMDLFAFFVDETGKVPSNEFVMFYNNPYLYELYDNNPGKEYFIDQRDIWGYSPESEAYYLHLKIVPKAICRIVFVWSLYDAESRAQDFSHCEFTRLRLGNCSFQTLKNMTISEKERQTTIAQWEISKPVKNVAVINLAELKRTETGWKINFNDEPLLSKIEEVCSEFGMSI